MGLEVRLSRDEIWALTAGVPCRTLGIEEGDTEAGLRSLAERGAAAGDVVRPELHGLADVLRAPGLTGHVHVEEGGLVRSTWLLATPEIGCAARTMSDGDFVVEPFATASYLTELVDRTSLQVRPDHQGRLTTTRARIAAALDAAANGHPGSTRLLTAAGSDDEASRGFLLAMQRRQRTSQVEVLHAAGRQLVGVELAWVDGGEHGLWLVPPFADGQLDHVEHIVAATTAKDVMAELREGLPQSG